MAMTVLVMAACASLLRGRRYVHDEHGGAPVTEDTAIGASGELAVEVAAGDVAAGEEVAEEEVAARPADRATRVTAGRQP